MKSAAEYIAEFQRWANRTKWNNIVLMYMFKRGLKKNDKDQFI